MNQNMGSLSLLGAPAGLLAGSTVIVASAMLLATRTAIARRQRVVWQAAILGLLVLAIGGFSGAGEFLAIWCRGSMAKIISAKAEATVEAADVARQDAASTNEPRGISPRQEFTHATEAEHVPFESHLAALPAISEQEPPLSNLHESPIDQTGDQASQTKASNAPLLRGDKPRGSIPSVESERAATEISPSLRWLLLAWFSGCAWMLASALLRQLRLWRMVRRSQSAAESYTRHVQVLAGRLGIRRTVTVREISTIVSPVAFGIIRPTIGLPSGFCREFTRGEQDAMLLHELSHLGGRDPLWRVIGDAAVALWWWQPLAWWARAELRAVSEMVADEASLLLDQGPETLAECLVRLGRQLIRTRPLGWSGIEGGGFRSALGRRVARLMNLQDRTWRGGRTGWMTAAAFSLAIVLAAAALAGTAWSRTASWQSHGETSMTIQQAWKRSLGSLTLLAAFGPGGNAIADDEGRRDPPPAAERREERPAPPPGREERRGPDGQERRGPDRGGPERGPRDEGRRREGDDEGRLDRLKRDAQRLRQEGKTDDAARVEKEFRDALTKMLKYTLPQLPEDVRGKLQPKIEQYLKARDDGKYEEAEKIEAEAKEIIKPFEGKIIDPHRKIHHLRGAADNLRAAGMTELADKLTEQVGQLEKEFGAPPIPDGDRRNDRRGPDDRGPERGGDRGPNARGPEGRSTEGRGPERRGPDGGDAPRVERRAEGPRPEGPRDGGGRDGDPQQELVRVLRELRNDVENLRREVKELRGRAGQPEGRKPPE